MCQAVVAPEFFFFVGGIGGKNPKICRKWPILAIIFFWRGGGQVGDRASDWGANAPHAPLDATTGTKKYVEWTPWVFYTQNNIRWFCIVFSPMKFIFYRFSLNLLQLYINQSVRVYPLNASRRLLHTVKIGVPFPFHQRTYKLNSTFLSCVCRIFEIVHTFQWPKFATICIQNRAEVALGVYRYLYYCAIEKSPSTPNLFIAYNKHRLLLCSRLSRVSRTN